MVPNVDGVVLYHKGGSIKRQRHMVIALRPCTYEVIVATSKESIDQGKSVERLDLRTDVMSMYSSFRPEFRKRSQHSVEMCGYGDDNDEDVHYLSTFEVSATTRWLEMLSKAKKFAEWFSRVKCLLARHEDQLTEHIIGKLREIVDFC